MYKPKNDKLAKEESLFHINFCQRCLYKVQEDSNENQWDSDYDLDVDSDDDSYANNMDYLVNIRHGYTYEEVYEELIKPKNYKLTKEESISHINFSQSCLSKVQDDSNGNQGVSDGDLDVDSDDVSDEYSNDNDMDYLVDHKNCFTYEEVYEYDKISKE